METPKLPDKKEEFQISKGGIIVGPGSSLEKSKIITAPNAINAVPFAQKGMQSPEFAKKHGPPPPVVGKLATGPKIITNLSAIDASSTPVAKAAGDDFRIQVDRQLKKNPHLLK